MEDKHTVSSGCVYKDLDICHRAFKAVNNHDKLVGTLEQLKMLLADHPCKECEEIIEQTLNEVGGYARGAA